MVKTGTKPNFPAGQQNTWAKNIESQIGDALDQISKINQTDYSGDITNINNEITNINNTIAALPVGSSTLFNDTTRGDGKDGTADSGISVDGTFGNSVKNIYLVIPDSVVEITFHLKMKATNGDYVRINSGSTNSDTHTFSGSTYETFDLVMSDPPTGLHVFTVDGKASSDASTEYYWWSVVYITG